MKKLRKYCSYMDPANQTEERHTMYDAGAAVVQVYDFRNDRIVVVEQGGDWSFENTSPYAEELVELVDECLEKAFGTNSQ